MYQYLNEGDKKKLFNVVFIAIIFLAAYLAISSLNALKQGQNIGRVEYPANVISVSGTGEVLATPDTGSFSFAVIEEGKTVKEAQDKASKQINAVIAGVKSMGVEEKDIKTTSYNAYPKYDYARAEVCSMGYCPPGKQVLTGYEVSQTITVKIRKTADAGSVLTKAGELGAKNISGLDFVVDDMDKVNEEARDKAIKDAKQKAEVLSKSLGVKLKKIVSFSEGGVQPPIYYAMGGAMMEKTMATDAASPVPQIPTGENKITSYVTITYEVE